VKSVFGEISPSVSVCLSKRTQSDVGVPFLPRVRGPFLWLSSGVQQTLQYTWMWRQNNEVQTVSCRITKNNSINVHRSDRKEQAIALIYVSGLSCQLSDRSQISTLHLFTNRNCLKLRFKNAKYIEAQKYPLILCFCHNSVVLYNVFTLAHNALDTL